jgi:hypothetical protein
MQGLSVKTQIYCLINQLLLVAIITSIPKNKIRIKMQLILVGDLELYRWVI